MNGSVAHPKRLTVTAWGVGLALESVSVALLSIVAVWFLAKTTVGMQILIWQAAAFSPYFYVTAWAALWVGTLVLPLVAVLSFLAGFARARGKLSEVNWPSYLGLFVLLSLVPVLRAAWVLAVYYP